ncbi:glycosyltransferase family 2 protein [uncultured Hymenobacter sp.]|uniref:glycosyltransferase family 2 protein n=1 Tax=uncultured Hymenobacter sp. TaxID=170016 RepID=UPI0035CBC842
MVFFGIYLAGWLLAVLGFAARLAGRGGAGVPPVPLPQSLPRVSILVAARNEEQALPRCLAALRALHYPPENVEIFVGDDASTDGTRAVAEAAMRGYEGRFAVLSISQTLGQARGKANVLAHLARAATTDYFFITDADIAVPPTWLQGLLAHAAPGVGTVTGITLVEGPRLLDRLQGLDWLFSLGLAQVATEAGHAVTAMGNNMLVTRAAYAATGGYEALPFSIIEDYTLFRAVLARGFGYRHVFGPEVLAVSLPIRGWAALLRQRRRWLRGVEALPWRPKLGVVGFSSVWVALLGLALVAGPGAALLAWALKLLVQGALVAACFRRAGRPAPWHLLPAFELYTLLMVVTLPPSRLLVRGVEWKGRQYN